MRFTAHFGKTGPQKPRRTPESAGREKNGMSRLVCGFLAVLCILWVILPDPVPIVVDDLLAAAAGALTAMMFFRGKDQDHPAS